MSQLNAIFDRTQDDVRRTNGGVAMALGASSVQLPLDVGEMGLVGSVGVYRGDTALNLKYQMRPFADFVLGVGMGITTYEGDFGASIGVGYKWR